jgi:hypothetical protein
VELGIVLAFGALILFAVAVREWIHRRPPPPPPEGAVERRSDQQMASVADTHKAAMALVSAVALGFIAAATLKGYVDLPTRMSAIEQRQAGWDTERIVQRVESLEQRLAVLEEATRFQTCRARQIDRGRDPSGCSEWLRHPDRYDPPADGNNG